MNVTQAMEEVEKILSKIDGNRKGCFGTLAFTEDGTICKDCVHFTDCGDYVKENESTLHASLEEEVKSIADEYELEMEMEMLEILKDDQKKKKEVKKVEAIAKPMKVASASGDKKYVLGTFRFTDTNPENCAKNIDRKDYEGEFFNKYPQVFEHAYYGYTLPIASSMYEQNINTLEGLVNHVTELLKASGEIKETTVKSRVANTASLLARAGIIEINEDKLSWGWL